jgi:hypothetical protein
MDRASGNKKQHSNTAPVHLWGSIEMPCALAGRRLPIQLQDFYLNGHAWAAPLKPDNHGLRRRSGKRWLEAPIGPHYCQRPWLTSLPRRLRRSAPNRPVLWPGMTSRRTHRVSLRYRRLQLSLTNQKHTSRYSTYPFGFD